MRHLRFDISRHSLFTDLFTGSDLLQAVDDYIQKYCQVICVVDSGVFNLYKEKILQFFDCPLVIPYEGEKAKSIETVGLIIDFLMQERCSKDCAVIAIGGGSILDVTGFVASIYMRGVDCIYIPTSLLAMVDAAIGGKTAIDHKTAKNILGAIYHPKAIFIDYNFIRTLTQAQILQGKAEIFKLSLVRDATLFAILEKISLDFQLVDQAVLGKFSIIEKDPQDLGLRRILNFGHTIGHALESISCFSLSHGEAVLLGCLVEAYLSYHLKFLSRDDFEKIKGQISELCLTLPLHYSRDQCLEALLFDKKRLGKSLRFVLIEKIGKAVSFEGQYVAQVSLEDVTIALKWMEDFYGFRS